MRNFIVNDILVEATIKDVRTLSLRVDRNGNAKMTIPRVCSEAHVNRFLKEKQAWLERAVNKMKERSKTEKALLEHRFEPGETFVVFGRIYTLIFEEHVGVSRVEERANLLVICSAKSLAIMQKRKLINAWISRKLYEKVDTLLKKWLAIMDEAPLAYVRYRRMKSRWGSMSPTQRVMCLNTKLAFSPEDCLEMVVVHELCHLKEPSHNARFHMLMAHYLPDYKETDAKLREFFCKG